MRTGCPKRDDCISNLYVIDGRHGGSIRSVQVQPERADGRIQVADDAEQLLVCRLDVFRKQSFDLSIVAAGRELAEHQVALDAIDDYLAQVEVSTVPQKELLLVNQGHGQFLGT